MQHSLIFFLLLLSFGHARAQFLPDRPTSETRFSRLPDGSEQIISRTYYTYSPTGSLLESRTEAPVFDSLFTSYLTAVYRYDVRDSLSSAQYMGATRPGGPAFRSQFVLTRDSRGNKLAEVSSVWDFVRDSWRFSQQIQQTFDEQNRLVSRALSTFDQKGQQWGAAALTRYTYTHSEQRAESATQRQITFLDGQGRPKDVTEEIIDNGLWTISQRTTTHYEGSRITRWQYSQPLLTRVETAVVTELTNDGKPRQVHFFTNRAKGPSGPDSLVSEGYNQYAYDRAGRLLAITNWTYAPGSARLSPGSGIRYQYGLPLPAKPALIAFFHSATGLLNFLNEGLYGCITRYELTDAQGRLMSQGTATVDMRLADSPPCSPAINLAPLPHGLYSLKLWLGDGSTLVKPVSKK